MIFKICHRAEWDAAAQNGPYCGSAKDREDGFLHFSTFVQLAGTLARYYAQADDLMLIAVDGDALGAALKYEPARDGVLFPHLYSLLPISAVLWVRPIDRDAHGVFVLPNGAAAHT